MSKIAIVSNAEEGVVIDISGCDSPAEAKHYLTSTLQVSSRFWEGLTVDINLGRLALTAQQVGELLSIVREVGVDPSRVLSSDVTTVAALYQVTKKEPGLIIEGQMSIADSIMAPRHPDEFVECCNDLPALSIEGQVTAIGNLTADRSDFAAVVTTAALEHPPLAQESPQIKIGAVALAGNRTTQELLSNSIGDYNDESPVVEEALRTSCIDVAINATVAHSKLPPSPLTVAAPHTVASPHLVPVVPSALATGLTPHGNYPTPPVIVAIPLAPALTPVNKTTPLASSGVANKSGQRNTSDRVGVLYLRQTLRSGQAVSHKGDLVIIGDVNPGAEVSAEGDITIWGALRGVAHAGTAGNASAEIRALKFDPIQLRIAHAIARAPDRSKTGPHGPTGPETARIFDGKIRISVSDPD